jgi:hypothetical protein
MLEIAEPTHRLWRWARQHRGFVMMSALLLAALVVPHRATPNRPPDCDVDETPLFI